MAGYPILSLVTFLPLAGALIVLVYRGDDPIAVRNIRWSTFWVTVMTFVVSLVVWANFDPANPGFQMEERYGWIGSSNYHLGVDGIAPCPRTARCRRGVARRRGSGVFRRVEVRTR